MMVLVSYDVSTIDPAGSRRLRRISKACKDFGQRVQFSVFEIEVDPAQWVLLRKRLCDEMDPQRDSLRFYFLGSGWKHRIEHIGTKASLDMQGPLIV
jgi:CRISPR-associated protein Cas2